jgi:hypothetical protein
MIIAKKFAPKKSVEIRMPKMKSSASWIEKLVN